MEIIDIIPRTADWHDWRAKGIGASESAIILNQSPYKTRWQLWAEKTGLILPESLDCNPHVQRGIKLEPIARAYFESLHDEFLFPICATSKQYPFIQASFDGINSQGEPVEIKCPSETVFNDVQTLQENSEAYLLYQIQVQHQMLVAGANRGWLFFYYEPPNDSNQPSVITFEIKRDETIIQSIIDSATAFWQLIQTKKPPIE